MRTIAKRLAACAVALPLTYAPQAFAQEDAASPSSVIESYKSWRVECSTLKFAKPAPAAAAKGDDKKADGKADKKGKKNDKKEAKAKPAASAPAQTEERTLCDAYQIYNNNKSGNEVARFIFSYVGEKGKDRKMVAGLRTLVDISFDNKPKVIVDGKDLIEGQYVRCVGNFCFIRFDMNDKQIKSMSDGKEVFFQYGLASGRNIRIKMSPNGLDGAIKSLKAKEK